MEDVTIAAESEVKRERGDWILTVTGKKFWPLDPDPGDVCIEDIGHALSMLCRFTGHCRRFYSVAEHSLLVAGNVPPKFRAWALLHDAAEAYIADISRPLKHASEMQNYRDIEERVLTAIFTRFELHNGGPELWLPPAVREADARACATEMRDLMPGCPDLDATSEPFQAQINNWIPAQVHEDFLKAAKQLGLE